MEPIKQKRLVLHLSTSSSRMTDFYAEKSANEQENGKVGSRTRWSKERGGPSSGTEPYDARVSRTVPLRRV